MVTMSWIYCLDKRPEERTQQDLDTIFHHLKQIKALEKFHPLLLEQLCYYCYYEKLDKNVVLFRQGDIGTNWYAVLSGRLALNISETGFLNDAVTLCQLNRGAGFGESVLNNTPRHATVVTLEPCELIRVEQKDFKPLWEKNLQLSTEGSVAVGESPTTSPTRLEPQGVLSPIAVQPTKDQSHHKPFKLKHEAQVIRTVILTHSPHLIRDQQQNHRIYRRCMVGCEMVDWLLAQGVESRVQACGVWQSLIEDGPLVHVCKEHQFKDKYLFYIFDDDDDDHGIGIIPNDIDRLESDKTFGGVLTHLVHLGSDALIRMSLRKEPSDRTAEDLAIIYEELVHIKALSHLSTSVKRQLAGVFFFESHTTAGTILFRQGDQGHSWYIIWKGSVNVVIYGKGVVCSLKEGDDFGKLAVVNETERSATIVLHEDNCQFLRVDKHDFDRILKHVEKNTVRLKEHGEEVLVLEKNNPKGGMGLDTMCRYSVMAGTPEKMLEHILESRLKVDDDFLSIDAFEEDFLLTYVIFMPNKQLCEALRTYYQYSAAVEGTNQDTCDPQYALSQRRKVTRFVVHLLHTQGEVIIEDKYIKQFIQELLDYLHHDDQEKQMLQDIEFVQNMARKNSLYFDGLKPLEDLMPPKSPILRKTSRGELEDRCAKRNPIKPCDTNILKIFCADHTYTTLKLPMDATAKQIIQNASVKLDLENWELLLCEVKSNGEVIAFKERDVCPSTRLSVNGRLFITPKEHIDALTPLPEQEGPTDAYSSILEHYTSEELAYQLTLYDWELFTCVAQNEWLYPVTKWHSGTMLMANLDTLARRFDEIQYWVMTEICLTQQVSKRTQLLKKMIKVAHHCRKLHNLCSFTAIVMGLSHMSISRQSQIWEKLPSKLKRLFSEFELVIDPLRNHKAYRLIVDKMDPPVIPFVPLVKKDIAFIEEGNKTYYVNNLVNFEKMHMFAQTIKSICHYRSKNMVSELHQPNLDEKGMEPLSKYVRNLKVIDNQKILNMLSQKLEPRRS